MDAKTLFSKAAKQADSCVGHIHDDQLLASTPCAEWNLKTLLNHLVYELSWVPDLLEGKTVAEVGSIHDGDLLGGDYQTAWRVALTAAQKAVDKANLETTVHLSYGDVTASHYIREIAGDLAIHGWDMGQSERCNIIIDADVAQAIYNFLLPRKAELRASRLFGEEFPSTPTDTIQTKLLALVGRKAYSDNDVR